MFKTTIFTLLVLLELLPENGLAEYEPKIVGGSLANIKDYPYQVSFQFWGSHSCGGAIINENTIVTAAHCVTLTRWFTWFVKIQAGSSILYEGGQTIGVSDIYMHPEYDMDSSDNDIAVLKLSSKLVFGKGVQPIALPSERAEAGVVGIATGWGKTSRSGGITKYLNMVQMPVFDQETCVKIFQKEIITENMFCAGHLEGGKDTCQGDSGGPLAYDGKLLGVVSWGYACAAEGFPGIFTDITKYLDYIAQYA